MSNFGTIVRGIKAPIIRANDNLEEIIFDSVTKAINEGNIEVKDKDVICITESIVAKSQSNFVTLEQVSKDIKAKMKNSKCLGVLFPIMSRNRFSLILKAISLSSEKVIIQFSYPKDEVGNQIISADDFEKSGLNPYGDILSEKKFREHFKNTLHPFTGVDYITLYKEIAPNAKIIFSNNPKDILIYTKDIIQANIHDRARIKNRLLEEGANIVLGLDEIMNESIDGSGYNQDYGLLGSNMSTENSLKLFPRDSMNLVNNIQKKFQAIYGKTIEVMIYGDGAFKDPIGGIWELADPVISPFYTSGLDGTPNELKMKYIVDNALGNLDKENAEIKMKELIKEKKKNLVGTKETLGTTPRRLTDLLGSLADLTSGSGDKGTPIIYIQNYFLNFSD